jgi:hypothetical protein
MTISYLCALALLICLLAQDNSLSVSDAKKDENGILVHAVQSHYQAGKTEIRVLLPDRLEKGKRHSVIYVLPVEARHESHYGDGLLEVKKHDLVLWHIQKLGLP